MSRPNRLGAAKDQRRAGSDKRSKTAELVIHEEQIIQPKRRIAKGSRFKGYRDIVIQDLVIRAHNTRYRLARWLTPKGDYLIGELPAHLTDQHFGTTLRSYLLYQHHHCQVTQPLLREQLREWGIDISSGTIDALLSADQEVFHAEKDDLLKSALATARYVTVDDTGARHQGKNGYVTQIGNADFAWFQSTESKDRINFLELLCAGETGYRIKAAALGYMYEQGLPQAALQALQINRRPSNKAKRALAQRFDILFSQKTCYQTLNQLLRRLHQNKAELLLVLERPEIPLHTNASERDIRDYVSLKKTCRKLGVSFWDYLNDRISQADRIPGLPNIIEARTVPA
jgi:hypothetical protein